MPSTVTLLAAGLGASHGYTIEGDSIRLHADIVVYDVSAARTRDWSLQLWACDNAFDGSTIAGHKVADFTTGPLSDHPQLATTVHATTAFHAPAGGGEFTLVLLLVADPGEIHGYASYPRRETFFLPRIRGHVGYRIDDRRVTIDVAAIENPRDESNLSGTLALELWALSQPYSGGHFNGAPLAAVVLGTLAGRSEWNPPPLDLAFKAPPDGRWHFCLMLREWTGTSYTTRDYINFAEPVAHASEPLAAGETPPTRAPFTEETTTLSSPVLSTPVVSTPPPKPARRAVAPKTKPSGKTPGAAEDAPVSINKATAAELTAIKGLSKPLAAAIVAARPFESLDALLEVKGLGPKLYAKLKPLLKL